VFDRWSLVHLGTGVLFGYSSKVSPLAFLLLHSAFEVWENSPAGISMWRRFGFGDRPESYRGDSAANIVGDTVSAMLGFMLGSAMKRAS